MGQKSLEKGFGGDSPQCGEMSEGQRGPPPSEGTFPQKGFPPIEKYIILMYTLVHNRHESEGAKFGSLSGSLLEREFLIADE